MKLTIADRISLTIVLPEKDDFTNLCLKSEILDKTKFSSEEIEINKITSMNGNLSWQETEPKEFEFKAAEITYIMSCLKSLSDKKELTLLQVPLYKTFAKL